MHATLKDSLAAFLASGQRSIERWAHQHRLARVHFDETDAFFNANTPADLRA
jgi:molybdopterin-guanine dinucleotide biosynthesis protein A